MLVYILQNKINGKCYVGQTISSINKRISQHLYNINSGQNYPIYNAIRKYGIDNFDIKTIQCDSNNQKDLNKLECDIIEDSNSMVPNGYNLRPGGSHGKPSEESNKKNSESHKGKKRKPLSEEWKRNLSESHKGQVAWNKGKVGIFSEESRQKMSEVHKGEKNFNYGKRGKEHQGAKSIILIHLDGKEEKFDCMMDACRKYNLSCGNLSTAAQGKRKQHKGFKCRYV